MKRRHIKICDFGDMSDGLFVVFFPALNIRAIRFVLVRRALYITAKQNPRPNLWRPHTKSVGWKIQK